MKSNRRIYLVGLPGSGKTTLGRQLAERLELRFIDLDEAIVAEAGKSIPEIFSRQGESNFRVMEREVLRSISAIEGGFVMATGGGTPCHHANMDFMNEHGRTVYLDVSLGDLALRLTGEGVEKRPLFKSCDEQSLTRELSVIKENRRGFYNQATIKIKDNQMTVDLILKVLSF